MDDKVSRHKRATAFARNKGKQQEASILAFLFRQRNLWLTGFLLCIVILLLFGIASRLPIPNSNTVPYGDTELPYSEFLTHLKNGNVEAVLLQENELSGLLQKPLSGVSAHNATDTTSSLARAYDPYQPGNVNAQTWLRERLEGTSSARQGIGPDRSIFVHIPAGMHSSLTQLLNEQKTYYTILPSAQTTFWHTFFWKWLPFFLFAILLFAILFQQNRSLSGLIDKHLKGMGKSRARLFAKTQAMQQKDTTITGSRDVVASTDTTAGHTIPQTTFKDVAGIDEVRADLIEIVQFLQEPDRFHRLGARLPSGALLVGPPGTGKTLLAKAVAGEAGVPFLHINASEFVEIYAGIGASRVRNLFEQARQKAPCVIFIDEIDAAGRKRTPRASGNDEREQTLNQLLIELDGFNARQTVVVLAATNRVDILDKALLRPGRFDRRITLSPPDCVGREAILRVHTHHVPLHKEVTLTSLAQKTTGMTGADLANLVNEAALLAARQDLEQVTGNCFEDALARVQLGAIRPLAINQVERQSIAIHESGHALVAHHLPEADDVHSITILPRGQKLGITRFNQKNDRYHYRRESLLARIAVTLGGRIAEELTLGHQHITTGAEDDIQAATKLAHDMVTRWGMSERVGLIHTGRSEASHESIARYADHYDQNGTLRTIDEKRTTQPARLARRKRGSSISALIDSEVQQIIREGHTLAHTILTEHKDQLHRLSQMLLEREQLDQTEFEAIIKA